MQIAETVASRLGLPVKGTSATIHLLDEGATVPFISRYRKERTGGMTDEQVRDIEITLRQVRELEKRKDFIISSIEAGGFMTPDLKTKIVGAVTMTELEDIYAPYKPKRNTRAESARKKGLEPLARKIMSGYLPTHDEEQISGASDIIAEWASESVRLRNITRNTIRRAARLETTPVKGKEEELASSSLSQYGEFSQGVRNIMSHQYLAMRRAERNGLVKVKFNLGKERETLDDRLVNAFMPSRSTSETADIVTAAVEDASRRLLIPSVENEVSSSLKEEADKIAIDIFSRNLRQLLMERPLKDRRILAIDPGYRTGCKIVALDETGTLLADAVIYPVPPKSDISGAGNIVREIVCKYHLDAVAIGNGTASRETEIFIRNLKIVNESSLFIVNEDGASIYSASELGRKEFPDKDVTVRGAVSIGRRLMDPLAELVKIDPKSIGVGQYQHDVDQRELKDALDYTVMACVNAVGVNVNTASESLLSYVSGIGSSLAANIVRYRSENGPFRSRAELKKVPRLGDKAFEQCAGFLRITDGKEVLDNTGIHPENYDTVRKIAASIGKQPADLIKTPELLEMLDIQKLEESGIGSSITITDIITELRKPGRDPRLENDGYFFTPSVESFEQLTIGQKVRGKVNNITAFGAFVNLGIKENGLIHISKLSRKRVTAVSDILSIGDIVEATIIDIDNNRRRISLSLI